MRTGTTMVLATPCGALLTTDVILDVRDMVARAPKLGPDVRLVRISGGAHDLSLSPEPARTRYIAAVLGWLDERVRTSSPASPGGSTP